MLAIDKITAEGQTSVGQTVDAVLKVAPGDLIAREFGTDVDAALHHLAPMDLECLRATERTLSEWSRWADQEAYRAL